MESQAPGQWYPRPVSLRPPKKGQLALTGCSNEVFTLTFSLIGDRYWKTGMSEHISLLRKRTPFQLRLKPKSLRFTDADTGRWLDREGTGLISRTTHRGAQSSVGSCEAGGDPASGSRPWGCRERMLFLGPSHTSSFPFCYLVAPGDQPSFAKPFCHDICHGATWPWAQTCESRSQIDFSPF